MIHQFVVPGPIEDVEEIRVLQWHREEGKPFANGDLLVELETHKAVVEVRSTRPGVLRRILCREGEWRAIGKPLALLSDLPDELLPGPDEGEIPPLEVEFDIV
jgi:pyruvate/2-oxoglutarate dehydrogenase complex dihydrolipoamide acyltransferase (E2) component